MGSSDYISMNRLWWGNFTEKKYPETFYDNSGGFIRGSVMDTELFFWRPGRILDSLFVAPLAYFIIRYPESRMGRQFIWSGCLFS